MARAQAAALDSVGNYVAKAGMNAMPWPETHLPPRKAAKDKTVHVTGSVSWMKKKDCSQISSSTWMGSGLDK